MAIQCDYIEQETPETTREFKNAFWKISHFQGNDKDLVDVTVLIYPSESSNFAVGKDRVSFTPSQSGGEIRKQAYEFMMGLDKFKNAVII